MKEAVLCGMINSIKYSETLREKTTCKGGQEITSESWAGVKTGPEKATDEGEILERCINLSLILAVYLQRMMEVGLQLKEAAAAREQLYSGRAWGTLRALRYRRSQSRHLRAEVKR